MSTTDSKNKKRSLYDSFKTDADLEKEGIWIDFGPAKIKIKRAGGSNKAFQSRLRANLKPYKYQIDKGLMDEEDERYQKAFMDAFCHEVVLDWEDDEGNKEIEVAGDFVPFSPEAAKKLFADLEEIFAEVLQQSTKVANFRRKEVEDQAKKSKNS